MVSSDTVCYAGNLFGSVPWANRYILESSENFVELLVELFWSVQVVFKKTLKKSQDYSRLFSKEKRRLKNHQVSTNLDYLNNESITNKVAVLFLVWCLILEGLVFLLNSTLRDANRDAVLGLDMVTTE